MKIEILPKVTRNIIGEYISYSELVIYVDMLDCDIWILPIINNNPYERKLIEDYFNIYPHDDHLYVEYHCLSEERITSIFNRINHIYLPSNHIKYIYIYIGNAIFNGEIYNHTGFINTLINKDIEVVNLIVELKWVFTIFLNANKSLHIMVFLLKILLYSNI